MLVQLKEALGYAAYITCTTFLPNAVNVVTLFYGALSPAEAFAACAHAMVLTSQMCSLHCVSANHRCACRREPGAG